MPNAPQPFALFRVPRAPDGVVRFESFTFDVRDERVICPVDIGYRAGWLYQRPIAGGVEMVIRATLEQQAAELVNLFDLFGVLEQLQGPIPYLGDAYQPGARRSVAGEVALAFIERAREQQERRGIFERVERPDFPMGLTDDDRGAADEDGNGSGDPGAAPAAGDADRPGAAVSGGRDVSRALDVESAAAFEAQLAGLADHPSASVAEIHESLSGISVAIGAGPLPPIAECSQTEAAAFDAFEHYGDVSTSPTYPDGDDTPYHCFDRELVGDPLVIDDALRAARDIARVPEARAAIAEAAAEELLAELEPIVTRAEMDRVSADAAAALAAGAVVHVPARVGKASILETAVNLAAMGPVASGAMARPPVVDAPASAAAEAAPAPPSVTRKKRNRKNRWHSNR